MVNIFAVGGPASVLSFETTTGVGLTNGTFTGVQFDTVTGFGNSCIASVVVGAGSTIVSVTVTNGGEGYASW